MPDEHTPGDWFADELPDGRLGVRSAGGRFLAVILTEEDEDGVEWPDDVANSVLMAKAPQLLNRCRHLTAALWRAFAYLQRIRDEEQPPEPLWSETSRLSADVAEAIRVWGEAPPSFPGTEAREGLA